MKMIIASRVVETEAWRPETRPGYLGKTRDDQFAEWMKKYPLGWTLSWKAGDIFLDFVGVCRLYEDAYFAFLEENPQIVDELTGAACDVYDDAPTNVQCGFDYTRQETNRTHIQDIAIRNALLRMGRWFDGSELVQIRDKMGKHPLSLTLSPGRVSFHRPTWIEDELPPKWWRRGSVESFYQSNRWLLVRVASED